MGKPAIEVKNVSILFNMNKEKVDNLKEYFLKLVKHQLMFTEFWALRDISFSVEKGERLGILGFNGAGKSTLLKTVAGVLKPTKGTVTVHGVIAPLLELGAGFDQDLTAKENIFLNGAILGYSKKFLEEKYDDIIEFSELKDFIDQPVRTFSSGMMMRLAFSIATLVEPEVLIVDEILSVGDGHFQKKSEKRMRELMSGGTTVLMVSHALKQIRDLCNRVIWLEHGKVIMDGPTQEVCDAYEQTQE